MPCCGAQVITIHQFEIGADLPLFSVHGLFSIAWGDDYARVRISRLVDRASPLVSLLRKQPKCSLAKGATHINPSLKPIGIKCGLSLARDDSSFIISCILLLSVSAPAAMTISQSFSSCNFSNSNKRLTRCPFHFQRPA